MIITGDTVGLAKQSQLPASLTANGNLKTAIQEFTAAFSYRNITTNGINFGPINSVSVIANDLKDSGSTGALGGQTPSFSQSNYT